jgi:hypothetical protein
VGGAAVLAAAVLAAGAAGCWDFDGALARCEASGMCAVQAAGDGGATLPDAGGSDAGSPDAGSTPDAGGTGGVTGDAGTADAGTPDAGTPDAGAPDAGGCPEGLCFVEKHLAERQVLAAWAASPTDAWLVGTDGLVQHFDGTRLGPAESLLGSGEAFRAVWGTGPSDVWAVGDCGAIFRWTGARWTEVDRDPQCHTESYHAVAGTAAGELWVAGERGTLRHRTADGTWSSSGVGSSRSLKALWVGEDGNGWVAGTSGESGQARSGVWRLTANALTAQTLPLTATTDVSGEVLQVGPTQVFATGASGALLSFDGTTWRRTAPFGSGVILSGLASRGSADVLVVGGTVSGGMVSGSGTVGHFGDTGWSALDAGTAVEGVFLTDVLLPTATDVWLVGYTAQGGGLLLRFQRPAP